MDELLQIKPLTLLVGRNSSGKSSFARVFPMIRQSLEQKTKGPFLWYGRYVDFGSFSEARSRFLGDDQEMEFCFRVPVGEDAEGGPTSAGFSYMGGVIYPVGKLRSLTARRTNAEVTVGVKSDTSGGTFVSSVSIRIFGVTYKILFSNRDQIEKLTVGEYEIPLSGVSAAIYQDDSIVPRISLYRRIKVERAGRVLYYPQHFNPAEQDLFRMIKGYFVHGNTRDEKIRSITRYFSLDSKNEMKALLAEVPTAVRSWADSIESTSVWSARYKKLRELIFAARFQEVLEAVSQSINSSFRRVRYIEPLRATAQRYYRRQELAVDEIDSKGANVAMYIDSLPRRQRAYFDQWLRASFGFSVTSSSQGGHVSLAVSDGSNGAPTNIADMGFGYSQLLPVAVQLWSSAAKLGGGGLKRRPTSDPEVVVVEQPELHLHPGFQARLADVMVGAINLAKDRGRDVSIIAETHSSTLVNRLGELVADGVVSMDDVQVVLFEKSSDGVASLRVAEFDRDGVLQNWPFGFFEADVQDVD